MERYYTCALLLLSLLLQPASTAPLGSEYDTHTLEAPHDLQVRDPGALGLLLVSWSPPEGLLARLHTCRVRFKLTYLNTFQHWWSVIQTPSTSRRVEFDLSRQVKVRVHTLVAGPCTANGTEVQSRRYAEWFRPVPALGSPVVRRLACVSHRMEFIECTWEPANHTAPAAEPRLYYWHSKLGATRECPKYIVLNATRRGCNFTQSQLPDFNRISICVNSSSPSGGASTPTYLYFKVQDHVKPAATEELSLKVVTDPEPQLQLVWGHPAGRVPGHCLQWEVELNPDGPSGGRPTEKWNVIMATSLRTPLSYDDVERVCFRVRSKLMEYCAERGHWSHWSHWECHKATTGPLQ